MVDEICFLTSAALPCLKTCSYQCQCYLGIVAIAKLGILHANQAILKSKDLNYFFNNSKLLMKLIHAHRYLIWHK